jgi:hypothetical protein
MAFGKHSRRRSDVTIDQDIVVEIVTQNKAQVRDISI